MNVQPEKIQYEIKLPLKVLAIFSGLLNIHLAYLGNRFRKLKDISGKIQIKGQGARNLNIAKGAADRHDDLFST